MVDIGDESAGAQRDPENACLARIESVWGRVLRDGVYVLPASAQAEQAFDEQLAAIDDAGGSAYVIAAPARDEHQENRFRLLFDRAPDYAAWLETVSEVSARLPKLDEVVARREESQLKRGFESINATDFFPCDTSGRAEVALEELSRLVNKQFSPDEPSATSGEVPRAVSADYQARRWATRRSLWIDRVACAWLIKRFIDNQAQFLWLTRPSDCPPDAVGFDFDGAPFTHIGERVTFEVLLAGFALEADAGLLRLGALVHYLDVGGIPVAEAPGVLALIGAARERCATDDEFLAAAGTLFDDLYNVYSRS